MRLLGKPGSERVAMLVIYQWGAALALTAITDWLDGLKEITGFWAAFAVGAIIFAVLVDNRIGEN